MSNVYEIIRGVKTVKDFTQSVNMGLHFVISGKINLKTQRCLPNVCQVKKNTPSRYLESVFLCPGRESNPHGRFGPRDFKSLVSTISPPGRWPVREGAERTAKIRNNSDNGNKLPLYTARVCSDMGLRGRFSVHISSEKADKGLIPGDVYMEDCRGGRFFVHTSSVHAEGGPASGPPSAQERK